jgi:hypothetical protein
LLKGAGMCRKIEKEIPEEDLAMGQMSLLMGLGMVGQFTNYLGMKDDLHHFTAPSDAARHEQLHFFFNTDMKLTQIQYPPFDITFNVEIFQEGKKVLP